MQFPEDAGYRHARKWVKFVYSQLLIGFSGIKHLLRRF
jgi:hypothetical protein